MRSTHRFSALFIFLFLSQMQFAQRHPILNETRVPGLKYFFLKTPWRVQLGYNVVDDDGKPFKDLFNVQQSWNIAPYAVKLAIEKECAYNINVELALNLNNFKNGKIVNGVTIASTSLFYSADLNAKYIFTKKYLVEPYFILGAGYTSRSGTKYPSVPTGNAGAGATIWILDNVLAANLQAMGKLGLASPLIETGANYTQHSLGVVYKFSGSDKKRLKQAREHLKLII